LKYIVSKLVFQTYFVMKIIAIVLFISIYFGQLGISQTKKPAAKKTTTTAKPAPTKPATTAKPAKTTTTVAPKKTATTAPAKPAPKPAPKAEPSIKISGSESNEQPKTPASPSITPEMQEAYDKLHGNNKKTEAAQPNKPSTAKPVEDKKTKTTTPKQPAKVAEKPSIDDILPKEKESGGLRFSIGIKGGGNYSTFGGVANLGNVTVKNVIGYHGGLILNLGGSTFSVQPEILYSQLGFDVEGTNAGQTTTATTTFNTIQVPLLLKLSLGGDNLRFIINAGGYGSYILNGRIKTILQGDTQSSNISFDGNSGRIEYGATAGAGVAINIGGAHLILEGRYNYGLGNNSATAANKDFKSQVIMGSLGILIPISGR
jgi:Outer membrane protein beta-barrel domain